MQVWVRFLFQEKAASVVLRGQFILWLSFVCRWCGGDLKKGENWYRSGIRPSRRIVDRVGLFGIMEGSAGNWRSER